MKIKLINPFKLYWFFLWKNIPIGISIINSALKHKSYETEMFDYDIVIKSIIANRDKRYSEIYKALNGLDSPDISRLSDYCFNGMSYPAMDRLLTELPRLTNLTGYDLAGISVMSTDTVFSSILIAKCIKELDPKTKIVLGGPQLEGIWDDYFDKTDYLDYIIRGPGSVPMLQLLESMEGKREISSVKSLTYKTDKNKIMHNDRYIYELESEYVPDYSQLNLDLYKIKVGADEQRILFYNTSYGCKNNCPFCVYSEKVQYKTPKKVVHDLLKLSKDYDCTYFQFTDASINCTVEYLEDLVRYMDETELSIKFIAYGIISDIDKYKLELLKKAGCVLLYYGIETIEPELQAITGKRHTAEQASQVLQDTYEANIKASASFMVGLPYEKEEHIKSLKKFIRTNKRFLHTARISVFTVIKGTPVYDCPENYGIAIRDNIAFSKKNKPIAGSWNYNLTVGRYDFDEINGLNWEQKVRQQEKHKRYLEKMVYYNLTARNYKLLPPYFMTIILLKLQRSNKVMKKIIVFFAGIFFKGKPEKLNFASPVDQELDGSVPERTKTNKIE